MTRLTIICISFIIVSLMFAGQSYAQIDPQTLLGAWHLDEGTGDITADASGNGNDGTLIGAPAWVAGQSGNALEFDGSSTYVDCGNAEAFNVNVFSVSFWFYLPSSTQGWNHIISRGNHDGVSVNWGVMMTSGAQRILYETFNDTTWSGIRVDTTPGQWHHIVATYDGDMRQLYHDGVLADSGSDGMLLDQSRAFVIGARSNAGSASDFFSGSIDEVGYFSVVLAPEDIETIMNDGLAVITGVGRPLARRPDPKDGAMLTDTLYNMSWEPGDFAVSHDVYLGDNFDDVNDGTGDTFRGNKTFTLTPPTFFVGFITFPYPDGLVPGTTYYWRVDEVNDTDPNSPWKGDVWSFWIQPRIAYNPTPADGTKFIDPNVDLSWTAGLLARVHYVYFGDNFDDVNNATGGLPYGNLTYALDTLEPKKTYYWRVDESDGYTMQKGDVWSFTTAGLGGGLRGEYYHWWPEGVGEPPPQEPVFRTFVLSRIDPQINWNWGDPGSPDPLVDVDGFACRWTGEVEAAFTETYTFYTTTDDGARLWVDGQEIIEGAWVQQGMTEWRGTIDLVAGQTYPIEMWMYEHGGGAGAELRWSSPRTPKQLIPQGALSLPIKAMSPNPLNGAAGVKQTVILSWKPGEAAASHQVYLGIDEDAVRNADTSSLEYKATKNLGSESYDPPGKLEWDTTYYWRVDEVNNLNPDSPWVGSVWSFTVADFIVIEDFEDYNDFEPDRIFDVWLDGWGVDTNGAEVGYAEPDFLAGEHHVETTIVHGGAQSMPYSYENNFKYSEAAYSPTQRDWTEEGVGVLSLWFYGDTANAAERMYVALNSGTAVYNDNANAAQIEEWTEWTIDLQEFTGVGLTNVNMLAIGFGDKNDLQAGGTGLVFFDDIRLYRPAP